MMMMMTMMMMMQLLIVAVASNDDDDDDDWSRLRLRLCAQLVAHDRREGPAAQPP